MAHPLDRLEVSTRALKRAQYEAFRFQPTGDGIRVRNESHADPAEHVYTVRMADGVPTACSCPADRYGDTACKHRIAVAIRRPALDTTRESTETADSTSAVPDGGETVPDSAPESCTCDDLPGTFPCWPCVRTGRRAVPRAESSAVSGDD
jgi:hypothetical protein